MLYTFESITKQDEQEKEFSVDIDLNFERDGEKFINDVFDIHVKGLSSGIEFDIEENTFDF